MKTLGIFIVCVVMTVFGKSVNAQSCETSSIAVGSTPVSTRSVSRTRTVFHEPRFNGSFRYNPTFIPNQYYTDQFGRLVRFPSSRSYVNQYGQFVRSRYDMRNNYFDPNYPHRRGVNYYQQDRDRSSQQKLDTRFENLAKGINSAKTRDTELAKRIQTTNQQITQLQNSIQQLLAIQQQKPITTTETKSVPAPTKEHSHEHPHENTESDECCGECEDSLKMQMEELQGKLDALKE